MGQVKLWWKAVRPFSFPASVGPVLLGTVWAWVETRFSRVDFLSFVLAFVGVVLLHCAGNLINDYFDYKKGLDTGVYGSRGVLVTQEMTSAQIRRGIGICFVIVFAIGLVLTLRCGFFVPILGLVGGLAALTYTARPFQLKYRGVGDLVIVLAFGPLVVLGSYMVQTQTFAWVPILLSLPITFLVDAILHANNTRDLSMDREKGIVTWAGILGFKGAKHFYDGLLLAAYVSVVVLVVWVQITPWIFATFLTLPVAWRLHRMMRSQGQTDTATFAFIDARTAQFHLMFGGLLTIALLSSLI